MLAGALAGVSHVSIEISGFADQGSSLGRNAALLGQSQRAHPSIKKRLELRISAATTTRFRVRMDPDSGP
jgi:hypothetical protein